jgi:hypothetical protein
VTLSTLTRAEYALARERPELLDESTEGAPAVELNRCVGCNKKLQKGRRGRKWCSDACRFRVARERRRSNGGAQAASTIKRSAGSAQTRSEPSKRSARYRAAGKRAGETSSSPTAGVPTNGSHPVVVEHEPAPTATLSLDRLVAALDDVATITITTRSGHELTLRL